MHSYEDEVGKRWGDTEAYRQSQAKTSKYSKDDFEAAKVDRKRLLSYSFTHLVIHFLSTLLRPRKLCEPTEMQSPNGFTIALLKCKRILPLCISKIRDLKSITTDACEG